MLTVRHLFNEMLCVLGVDNADYAPQSLRDRVLAGIREELQVMQMAGEDFYCREHASVAIGAGTTSILLDPNVQKVLEPVKFLANPLHRLDTREQLDDFGPTFLGQTSRTVEAGTKLMAFFVESLAEKVSGNLPDSVSITLHVVPVLEGGRLGTIYYDCIKKPPLYTAADLCSDVYPPVPHGYHESILLPLCRKNVTTSTHFRRNAALLPQINASYERALALLGLADPREPKPAQSHNKLSAAQPAPQAAA